MPIRSVSPPPPSKRRCLATGESSSTSTGQSRITVISWNVNGIAPFVQRSITAFYGKVGGRGGDAEPPKASLRDLLRRHGWPTLLFLQEVKINPDDAGMRRAVEKAVMSQKNEPAHSPEYVAHFCLPSDKHNARGFGRKVYGVCSIIRQDFCSASVDRVREADWDAEGRFIVVETKAVRDAPKLAIFNVYAVNGTDHPYKDPVTGEVRGTRHDRKLKVHRLLQAECRKLEAEGFGVILAGDMNVARSRLDAHPNLRTYPPQHCLNRIDFNERFFSSLKTASEKPRDSLPSEEDTSAEPQEGGLGMIDTFRHLHPVMKGYTHYPRGTAFGTSCDRVDMIMTSRSLEHAISGAGMYETPSERGPSDHVPIFARLDFTCDRKQVNG